jgi:DNA polymerase-3 subunit delta
VFYIFHGEDEFSQSEELSSLRGRLAAGDAAMADLNTTLLSGSRLTPGELRHACDTIPFLNDRRLVIVHGLLGRLAPGRRPRGQKPPDGEEPSWKRAFLDDLVAYLPTLPPTTRLIFVESQALADSHPILKVAKTEGEKQKAFIKLFRSPRDGDLPGWIQRRARAKGGTLSHEATTMLADLVGNDLRQLDQEIEKILVYAGDRLVTTEDVQMLVSRARETSIFDLVDCVGRRETDRALRLLHRLLDAGEAPLYVLAMLARQVRILIQVKELRGQGLDQKGMASRLKLHPYVVEKGLAQAHNFDMAQLEAAHHRLVETDLSIKTGKVEELLALDMLIVDLTRI